MHRFSFLSLVLLALPCAQTAAQARPSYDTADVSFVQGMMHHHAQAIVMSKMVPSRTTRADLRSAARKIAVSQRDEIATMQRWLEKRRQAVPAIDTAPPDTSADSMDGMGMAMMHRDPGHTMMPGMLTPAQLKQLARSRGAKFDSLFLKMMIAHHEGALKMVARLFASPGAGEESEMFQLASDIDADQTAEIARMQSMQHHPNKNGK